MNFPLFIKPAKAGDSLGIDKHSLVKNKEELNIEIDRVKEEIKKPVEEKNEIKESKEEELPKEIEPVRTTRRRRGWDNENEEKTKEDETKTQINETNRVEFKNEENKTIIKKHNQ